MARVKLIVDKEDVAPEHHALFDALAALRGRISGPSTVGHYGIVTGILNAFEVAPAPDAEPLPLGSDAA